MLTKLGKLSIRHHLILWFSLLSGAALVTTGWIIFSFVRTTIQENIEHELSVSIESIRTAIKTAVDVSIRNHLRAIAESNHDILAELNRRAEAQEITLEQAKREAEMVLLSQKIGRTGYIYAINEEGVLAVHPNPEMKDRNMSYHWLAGRQVKQRQGYLEYAWQNPGEDHERQKAMYMTYFQPWGWIISVSSYREEITSLVDIEDFRKEVESFRFGKSGYTYILSTRGDVIMHPWMTGTVAEQQDPHARGIFEKMQKMGSGHFTYLWQDPGEDRLREKLVFFTLLPEFDWIIASSIYLDEAYLPLQRLSRVMVVILAATILIVFFLSLVLSGLITRPLIELAGRMRQAAKGDHSVRAPEEGLGEIGMLGRHFNSYMERLAASTGELREEVAMRARTEQQLKLFAKVFENALEGISITDAQGNIVAVNQAFTTITGYSEQEALGRNPRLLKSDRHDSAFYQQMWGALLRDGIWKGEIWNRRKNGEAYPEILSISAIYDDNRRVTHYVAVFHDITEMKLKEEQIQHQAYHDALTGLPNRLLAQDRLTMALAVARRQRTQVAVYFMDLDNFKHINDSLGHAVGDKVLQSVGRRLAGLVRDEDTVARLGGDEFQIIGVDITSERQIVDLGERILASFSRPLSIEGHELHVTISIGAATYPADGKTVDLLTRNADAAMYQAKRQGKNSFALFTRGLGERAGSRLTQESELRQAIREREFAAVFQPKIDPYRNVVVGVEALARWHRPSGEIVLPEQFLSLAEETGMIVEIGELMLAEACEAIEQMRAAGFAEMKVAVNLSVHQFRQVDLVERVLARFRLSDIPMDRLELEITETAMMVDPEDSLAKLRALAEAGAAIAVDSFGTGYSSLYYLGMLPIDTLKIDRSFILQMGNGPSDAKLVETIILMARNLGIRVVAGGVETTEQLEVLKSFGCDLVQGYLFSPPLPLAELREYLDRVRKKTLLADPAGRGLTNTERPGKSGETGKRS